MMVEIMSKSSLLLAFVLLTGVAHADDVNNQFKDKLSTSDASRFNVGVGVTQKLLHLNTEWVNPYGIAYVKAGVFLNDDHTIGGQFGFRSPVHLTGKDKNGYYVGVYAGDIEAHTVDDKYKARLGGGIDLSYILLSSERLSSFGVGIGAGKKLKNSDGRVVAETEPRLQFSYTFSIGL